MYEFKKVIIKKIFPVEERQVGEKTFKSRRMWVENSFEDPYTGATRTVAAEFEAKFERQFEMMDNFKEKDLVDITFNLGGMMGVSKKDNKPYCINKLVPIKIELCEASGINRPDKQTTSEPEGDLPPDTEGEKLPWEK